MILINIVLAIFYHSFKNLMFMICLQVQQYCCSCGWHGQHHRKLVSCPLRTDVASDNILSLRLHKIGNKSPKAFLLSIAYCKLHAY